MQTIHLLLLLLLTLLVSCTWATFEVGRVDRLRELDPTQRHVDLFYTLFPDHPIWRLVTTTFLSNLKEKTIPHPTHVIELDHQGGITLVWLDRNVFVTIEEDGYFASMRCGLYNGTSDSVSTFDSFQAMNEYCGALIAGHKVDFEWEYNM